VLKIFNAVSKFNTIKYYNITSKRLYSTVTTSLPNKEEVDTTNVPPSSDSTTNITQTTQTVRHKKIDKQQVIYRENLRKIPFPQLCKLIDEGFISETNKIFRVRYSWMEVLVDKISTKQQFTIAMQLLDKFRKHHNDLPQSLGALAVRKASDLNLTEKVLNMLENTSLRIFPGHTTFAVILESFLRQKLLIETVKLVQIAHQKRN